MSVSVIAGLGNPGKSYEKTRHNVGFHVLDVLASKHELDWKLDDKLKAEICTLKRGPKTFHFIKPQSFMNLSGEAIQATMRYYKVALDSVSVIYDDVGLDLGRLKINSEGGAGGHNGIKNIIDRVGKTFVRIRIGVGAKYPPEIDLADYVLGGFSKEETDIIDQNMDRYQEGLSLLMSRGAVIAMNQFNKRKANNDADKKIL